MRVDGFGCNECLYLYNLVNVFECKKKNYLKKREKRSVKLLFIKIYFCFLC